MYWSSSLQVAPRPLPCSAWLNYARNHPVVNYLMTIHQLATSWILEGAGGGRIYPFVYHGWLCFSGYMWFSRSWLRVVLIGDGTISWYNEFFCVWSHCIVGTYRTNCPKRMFSETIYTEGKTEPWQSTGSLYHLYNFGEGSRGRPSLWENMSYFLHPSFGLVEKYSCPCSLRTQALLTYTPI